MFCRFGLELESRPVDATSWLKVVWSRPVTGSRRAGSGSRYVLSSLVSSRHSSTAGTMACWSRRPRSTLASVEYPVLPLRPGSRPRRVEEDLGQLLRRADGERAAGEPGDLVAELVDAVAHARRDLAEPVRVHLDAGGLHLGEDAHERELDLAEEPLEAELEQARPLRLGHAPREGGARGRGGLGRRPFDELRAVLGAGEREQRALLLRPLRREQVGRHGGVERRPGRGVHEPGLRLGVVRHGVAGQQPQRRRAAGVGRRHQAGAAAGVRGDGEAFAVAARLEGQRGLPFLEQGRHRADVRLGGHAHERAGGGVGAQGPPRGRRPRR